MTDTPATPDPQPTREAIWTVAHHLLLHCPRPSEKQVVALIDRFAAQHSTAALTAERAEARRAANGIIEAAREWRRREWGRASSAEIRESRRHTVDELDEDDASMALIDAIAEYDRARADAPDP